MGATTNQDLDDKIKRAVDTAITKEGTNRDNAIAKAKKEVEDELDALADLDVDNNYATGYFIDYQNLIRNQYLAKELMIQSAIQDFNGFLQLPPSSDKFLQYWDAAFIAISFAVPALRLTKFFAAIESEAKTAAAVADGVAKMSDRARKIVKTTLKGHDIADVIRRGNSMRDNISRATASEPAGVPLDSGKTPIKELLKESDDATRAFQAAIVALNKEYEARVLNRVYRPQPQPQPNVTPPEPLLSMAKRLLPPMPVFGPDEIGSTKKYYLWCIVKGWAKNNVHFKKTVYTTGTTNGIDGLNENQQEQLLQWFGPLSKPPGGRVPVCPTIVHMLGYWQVDTITVSSGGSIFGYG